MKSTNLVHARWGAFERCTPHVMQVEREVQVVIARDDHRRLQLTMSADEAEHLSTQLHNAAQLAKLHKP